MVNPEDIILNCYRLAEHYHQHPEVFTEMPFSRLNMHIYYTNRMFAVRESMRRRQENDG